MFNLYFVLMWSKSKKYFNKTYLPKIYFISSRFVTNNKNTFNPK